MCVCVCHFEKKSFRFCIFTSTYCKSFKFAHNKII